MARLTAVALAVALATAIQMASATTTCPPLGPDHWTPPDYCVPTKKSAADILVNGVDGDVPMSQYLGKKATMVMNVASACGLQNVNYAGAKKLIEKYGDSGFELVGVPCNQFCAQAPGSSECEREYAYKKFGIEFTILDKMDVNGPNSSALYTFMKNAPDMPPKAAGFDVSWNYEKFLLDGDGMPYARYGPAEDPWVAAEADIRALLGLTPDVTATANAHAAPRSALRVSTKCN